MLRFDIALQTLQRKLVLAEKAKPAPAVRQQQATAVLIPFPLRRLPVMPENARAVAGRLSG